MRKFVLSVFAILLLSVNLIAQDQRVSGTVTSEDGTAITGVTVMVKGTNTGAVTNAAGKFTISAPKNGTLQFSFIGMTKQEIAIAGRAVVNVSMAQDAGQIDDVIVIGYGSGQKIGTVVGSLSTVGSTKLASKPSANVADALQGKVSGLQIFSSTGEPGSSVSMRLRGVNSMNASNTPLIILDGSPVSIGVLTQINSNDIENITVLKDASSTAIYGSRAANGVVFITTKTGKVGEGAKIQLRAQYGVSMMTQNKLDMMNAKELLNFEEMVTPSLKTDAKFQAKKAFVLGNGIDTNWEAYYFKNAAPIQSYDISISNANDKVKYYASMGFYSQDGTAPRSGSDRYTFRSNAETKINKWLRFGANVGLSYEDYETSITGWYAQTATMGSISSLPYESPYEIIKNNDGTISYGDDLDIFPWNGDTNLKYYYDKFPNNGTTFKLNGMTYLQANPIEGLTIKASQSIDGYDNRYTAKRMPSYKPELGNGQVLETFSRYYQLTATNTAEYKWKICQDHSFTALVGQEAIVSKSDAFGVSNTGQADDRLMLLSAGTTPKINATDVSKSDVVFNSFFARLNYNFREKYYFDGSIRTDASSLFGKNNRWAVFYSLGGMWHMKKENFLKDVKAIDDLRLKASYGTTGNSGITNYLSYGLIGSGPSYGTEAGTAISNAPNPDLSWEVVKSLNVGVSARIANFLGVEIDFYNKITKDMLMEVPFSATTGHTGGWGNVGSMRNRGVDFKFDFDVIHNKDLYWAISVNANYNNNQILKLYGDVTEIVDSKTGFKFEEGKPYGEFFDVIYAGVDPRDGRPMWYDLNGNTTKLFSDTNAQYTNRNRFADWAGGFSTNLAWKNFTLDIDFSWVGDRYMWLNEKFYTTNTVNAGVTNFERNMFKMWTTPGQVTDVPRAGTPFNFDSSVYENASFIRLKNLSLGYSLPSSLLKKTGFIEGVRFYAIARNLLTFTSFRGYDPEVDSNGTQGTYPNSRQFTIGAEITF